VRGARLDAGALRALLKGIPVLHQNIIRFTYGHLEELEERFRELATERVAPWVTRQLIRLQEQVGSARSDEVEIGLSREDLPQMTGTTLYTVSRLLSAWEERSLVNSCLESMMISDVRALRKPFQDH
jgi:CRP-like cAMP-binding protein